MPKIIISDKKNSDFVNYMLKKRLELRIIRFNSKLSTGEIDLEKYQSEILNDLFGKDLQNILSWLGDHLQSEFINLNEYKLIMLSYAFREDLKEIFDSLDIYSCNHDAKKEFINLPIYQLKTLNDIFGKDLKSIFDSLKHTSKIKFMNLEKDQLKTLNDIFGKDLKDIFSSLKDDTSQKEFMNLKKDQLKALNDIFGKDLKDIFSCLKDDLILKFINVNKTQMEFFREIFFKKKEYTDQEIELEVIKRLPKAIEEYKEYCEKIDEKFNEQITSEMLKNSLRNQIKQEEAKWIMAIELEDFIKFFQKNSLNIYPVSANDLQRLKYYKEKKEELRVCKASGNSNDQNSYLLDIYKIHKAISKIKEKCKIEIPLSIFFSYNPNKDIIKDLNLISNNNIASLLVGLSECKTLINNKDYFLIFLDTLINIESNAFDNQKIKLFSCSDYIDNYFYDRTDLFKIINFFIESEKLLNQEKKNSEQMNKNKKFLNKDWDMLFMDFFYIKDKEIFKSIKEKIMISIDLNQIDNNESFDFSDRLFYLELYNIKETSEIDILDEIYNAEKIPDSIVKNSNDINANAINSKVNLNAIESSQFEKLQPS